MAVGSFLPIIEQEKSSHPDGSDGNCSGVSKPGWSSHWGSVLGFNVSEERSLSLSGIKKKKIERSKTQRQRRLRILEID